MTELLSQFIFPLILLVVTFLIGRFVERRHMRDLERRESDYAQIITTNTKRYTPPGRIVSAQFVHGEVVVGSDHFKTTVTAIRKFFGGNLRSVESLMLRARREALLRLLEEAYALGATHVINIRYESSSIGHAKMIAAEAHAYGTAVRVEP